MTFHVPPEIEIPSPPETENLNEFDHLATFHDPHSNISPPKGPSLLATISSQKSILIGIIEDVVTMMYSQQRGLRITAIQVLRQYDRLLAWRDGLSSKIARHGSDIGQDSPHVLSLL